MDKVLTRKMFKARYFQSLKPTIKYYKEGGLGSLTPQEKAYMQQPSLHHYFKQKEKVLVLCLLL